MKDANGEHSKAASVTHRQVSHDDQLQLLSAAQLVLAFHLSIIQLQHPHLHHQLSS